MKILKNWYFTLVEAFLNNARSLMGWHGAQLITPALHLVIMVTLASACFLGRLRIIGGRFEKPILILEGRIGCQREWQRNTWELGDKSSRNTGLTVASGELLPNFPTIFYISHCFRVDSLTEYLLPPTGRDIGQLSCVHIFMHPTDHHHHHPFHSDSS